MFWGRWHDSECARVAPQQRYKGGPGQIIVPHRPPPPSSPVRLLVSHHPRSLLFQLPLNKLKLSRMDTRPSMSATSLPLDMEATFRSQLMATSASAMYPLAAGLTMAPGIEPTIPRPVFLMPSYPLHGVDLASLPEYSQRFLAWNGLDDPSVLTPEWMDRVRQFVTQSLVDNVAELCRQIVTTNVMYNANRAVPGSEAALAGLVMHLRRELLPQLNAHVSHHLMLADALVWVDVTARADGPDALSVEEAMHYRELQTQPMVDLVTNYLVDLYAWLAEMWNAGWRMDVNRVLYRVGTPVVFAAEDATPVEAVASAAAPEPVLEPVVVPVASPPPRPASTPISISHPGTPTPQSDTRASPRTPEPTSPPRTTCMRSPPRTPTSAPCSASRTSPRSSRTLTTPRSASVRLGRTWSSSPGAPRSFTVIERSISNMALLTIAWERDH
ncbi:hypothetical protein B0H11DRAFT_1989686 [Mycena galericulata]|nr:hypothetical protein B0H11DRAFT_1989686 [Mycena galericulata]